MRDAMERRNGGVCKFMTEFPFGFLFRESKAANYLREVRIEM